jgi:hypothetical protein
VKGLYLLSEMQNEKLLNNNKATPPSISKKKITNKLNKFNFWPPKNE